MKIEFPKYPKNELLEEVKKWLSKVGKSLNQLLSDQSGSSQEEGSSTATSPFSKELRSRLFYGALLAIAITLFITAANALPHLFRLVCAIFSLWQLKELRQMSPFAALPKRLWVVMEAGLVIFLLWGPASQFFCASLIFAASAIAAIYYGFTISQLSLAIFSFIYFAIPLGSILQLNELAGVYSASQRQGWLIAALIIPKVYDMGAYFCGKTLGKTLIAPALSPNKTLEGFLGGAGFCAIALALLQLSFGLFSSAQMLLSFFIVPCLAQFGDLFESWIKRGAGVDHSGEIPGLGGVMDLSDAITWCAPYFLYLALGGML